MNRNQLLLACVVVISLGFVTTALVGADSVQASFSDTETGSGSVMAAEKFNQGGGGPPGNMAYNDANGNGQYDDGEETFKKNELRDFDRQDVNLVIPAKVKTVKDNNGVSITAGSIRSEVDIEAKWSDIDLTATNGDILLSGVSLSGNSGSLSVTAQQGTVNIDDTMLSKSSGAISVSGTEISARNADLTAPNGGITFSAQSGQLDATGADFVATNSDIDLNSNGDMILDSALVRSDSAGASADLGTNSATLSMDGATLDDNDQELTYQPNVSVNGTPDSGCVAPASGNGQTVCG